MYATFERFELELTEEQALSVAVGSRDAMPAVEVVLQDPKVTTQLEAIGPEKIRKELYEYGDWSNFTLCDALANRRRIVWLAGGNIRDEMSQRPRHANATRVGECA